VDSTASAGKRFVVVDRQLDHAVDGPLWLRQPPVAQCVRDTLFQAAQQWELYGLFAWVIMLNHVHVLLQPKKPLREVTRAVKNTSARLANRILGRTGEPFWQDGTYDHWVRGDAEFQRIVRYIERNPVSAGLVESIELWPWSSASVTFNEFSDGRSGTCLTRCGW
jgi:REP element-mobilizing transposase RayT